MSGDVILVAGGGAMGLCVALELARRGAAVVLSDPAGPADNASGVAAGMLAPAMEAVLDPAARDHFALLLGARDAWPQFTAGVELPIVREGAAVAGSASFVARASEAMAGLGAPFRGLTSSEVARLAPGAAEAVFTELDWRIDPLAALPALRRATVEAGVRLADQAVAGFQPGEARLANGERLAASRLVAATGAGHDLAGIAPELAILAPIKGQILHLPDAPAPQCVVRGEGVYVCPAAQGVVVGATMEPGRDDREIDPDAIAALRGRAAALDPALSRGQGLARAGVRAATPDGLPLVGASRTSGVWIAAGARRNGWLLAPLVADILAAQMLDQAAPVFSQALAARRFDREGAEKG